MNDLSKGKCLDMCDEFSWDVIFPSIFDFRHVGDPISKECKVPCSKSCE
jgi:hypothetical protein